MKNLFVILRGIFVLVAAIMLVGGCLFTILFARHILNKPASFCRKYPSIVSRLICRLAGVRVNIVNAQHLEPSQAYVFCGNHTSQFDIFSFYGYIPHPVHGLGKQELFSIPIFGHAVRAVGHIPINRTNRREAMNSLIQAAEKIKAGASVLIFPEGTRSKDGKLLPFKGGGMLLAIKAGVPIVPIAFQGSYEVMPKNTLLARPGTITLTIGKPFETNGYSIKDRNQVAEKIRSDIQSMLSKKT